MASTTFGKQLGVDSTVATPAGAGGGDENFLHGSSLQKALARLDRMSSAPGTAQIETDMAAAPGRKFQEIFDISRY